MATSILIADDHDDNRELLQLLLRGAGYEVSEARDGHECLQFAREQHPDVILVDLSMPGMDGWTVFRELQTKPETRTIPCIAVTAHAGLHRRQALDAGFRAYVTKPFRSDDLLEIIASVLAKRAATP
ncbi:MAG: two-component system, cell cycle response regulator DivK [Pyrinomonadaceae bacterium]|jgi:CheY-like chemotaxis protein|nr:two-component system, cell cycle response regulator DivK [Pyrinomonadaceae bacterium]